MKKITPDSPESKSADLVAENIARLKVLFPELVTEGEHGHSVNVDVLKQLVGDKTLTDAEEKYGLNWFGKRKARDLALLPSLGTLRPALEESVDWDTTQNLMIEGDNLEVLKLLQKSYAGKVKLIYIDPPYNTGKDFVYPDDFKDGVTNYQKLMGWRNEAGEKLSSLARNSEASGRFHTDWLNMMYPRLKLARNLLRKDGALFMSLDDTESGNARSVLNDIFGEEAFIGVFPWRSRTAKADVPYGVSKDVEWVIAYGNSEFLAGRSGVRKYFESSDYDSRWRLSDLTTNKSKDERPNSYFTMVNPKNGQSFPASPTRTWAVTIDTFPDYYRKGKIVFPGDYPFLSIRSPAFRVFESEDKEKAIAKFGSDEVRMSISTYLPEKDVGRTEHGSKDIRTLFESQVFSYPKPITLVGYYIANATEDDDLIMDFFAGSGTTGHAVMVQNFTDGGNRRHILVQLPEPLDTENNDQKTAADFCDKLGKPRTIAELTKERLRRAGAKIKAENPDWKGDTGFRVFKLDSSNIRAWNPDRENLEQTVLDHSEHLHEGRNEQDLLYEVLLKLGLDLCVPIEERRGTKLDARLRGQDDLTAYSVGGGVLMACLVPHITNEEVEAVGQGLVAWHKELAPAGETTCVFRDSAFADDVAKTNMTAILEQNGITTVRSL